MYIARELISRTHADTDYISLAEAKQHLRVTSSADDTYITGLIGMALDTCESYVGYSIRKAAMKYAFDGFTGPVVSVDTLNPFGMIEGNMLRLYTRVLSIQAIKYVDQNNTVQTATGWIDAPVKFGQFGRSIYFESVPGNLTDDDVRMIVELTEGFELASATGVSDSAKFPATIKHAALLLVAQYYDNRQTIIVGASQTKMDFNHEYLLDKYRIVKFD
jgi:hypothetical protein